MFLNEEEDIKLKDYREYKIKFHGEMMDICRKYLNDLSIVSILGILEIVKQETIELEKATREDFKSE